LSSGQSQRLPFLPLVFVSLLLIPGCGGLNPLSFLTGGGPNVAANVQAGAENNQGVNIKTEAPKVTVRPHARVEKIDQSVTNHVNVEPWMILVMLMLAAGGAIGWVDNILRLFKRKSNG
jgi:hypothetical protein